MDDQSIIAKSIIAACSAGSCAVSLTLKMHSVLISGGRVIDPANRVDELTDVLLTDGRIAALGLGLSAPLGTERVDATG